MKPLLNISATIPLLLGAMSSAYATNGMNMEGYGPKSTAMGGSSMAWDNGTAAVINNPATLLLQEDENRLDIALGFLGPDVKIRYGDLEANSTADAFFMPAMGYIHRNDKLAYGIAVFGQGGMGTEFEPDSFLAMGTNMPVKSEVSVGRVIFPLAWQVTDKLGIAATADIIWAGMDIQMPMNNAQFMDLTTPGMMNTGMASGTLLNSMMPFMSMGYQLDYARFDFADDSDFTGEAKGYGCAGKIGIIYEIDEKLTWGFTYHCETNLENLDTSEASMNVQLSTSTPPPGYPETFPLTLNGSIEIIDFQWPSTFGTGFAYRPNNDWLLTADVKRINWSDTMENFRMIFTADNSPSNDLTMMGGPDMRGQNIDATLYQYWDDQWVFSVGAAYQASETTTLRLGINHGKNPIPAEYTNPLFPAIVETHITGGFTYQIDDGSSFNLSLVYGIEKEAGDFFSGNPIVSMHGQLNCQIMYSKKW